MNTFLQGALAMGALTAGLFFFRSWRQTRDRLFALFAAAFWVFSVNWLTLALAKPEEEARPYFFLVRLLGFGLILIAIVDKNRTR